MPNKSFLPGMIRILTKVRQFPAAPDAQGLAQYLVLVDAFSHGPRAHPSSKGISLKPLLFLFYGSGELVQDHRAEEQWTT